MDRNDIQDIQHGNHLSANAINIIIRMQGPGLHPATRTLMSAGWLNHIEDVKAASTEEAARLVSCSDLSKKVHHNDSWIIPYLVKHRRGALGSAPQGHWIYILLSFEGYMWTIGDPGEKIQTGSPEFKRITSLVSFCNQTLNAGGPWEYRKTPSRPLIRDEDCGIHLIENVLALIRGDNLREIDCKSLRGFYLDRLSRNKLLPGQIPDPIDEYEIRWESFVPPKAVQLGRFCDLTDPKQQALYQEEINRQARIDLSLELPEIEGTTSQELKNHGIFAPHTTDLHDPFAREVMREKVKTVVAEEKVAIEGRRKSIAGGLAMVRLDDEDANDVSIPRVKSPRPNSWSPASNTPLVIHRQTVINNITNNYYNTPPPVQTAGSSNQPPQDGEL
ncbi:hypothetical protein GLAREA_07483 [Glarea lozoyensis ATCC 20868]|uniref:Uncharacterized protein n=2 Tax=Glarea lozoyensis TaxID=101852 RepID=S3D3K5_GLAL2|nr:uncharacterized protein GLAREA_07483 [Glarea lozoyensis ATCC 20868]EHK96878.1 hypothetical protein M7I_7422 [Glarea lozoyensis 74030]EPE32350.1 hypothetical protein GLAREA_07483 [Glarea lozoyensis ATCC 20868]